MSVITRFAPSPTGFIHIGNIRTALICYMVAKSQGGKFMLRLDDTDLERSKKEYADAIEEDLAWLGLNVDLKAKQSERLSRYEEVKQQLIDAGRLYPCFETPEEIEIKRKMLLSRGKPPIYDRSALSLTEDQKQTFIDQGKPVHWRFKLDEKAVIEWDDLVKGNIRFEAKNLSDPVLIRADGSPTYMLPSAIDDMDFAISHVVRGEDHVSNTAIQIQLFEALGSHIPTFAHHSLMKGKDGKISKRKGGFSIQDLRHEDHIEPMAILSMLARLGTSEPIEIRHTLQEILDHFDITTFTKNTAIYEVEDLKKLNTKLIHELSFDQVKDRTELNNIDETFWLSVRGNIDTLADIQTWRKICQDSLDPIIDSQDKEFTQKASQLLPETPWNEETWTIWVNTLKDNTDRKGKSLFMPLRKALTAQDHGPELKYVLPLIGREKAIARLNGTHA